MTNPTDLTDAELAALPTPVLNEMAQAAIRRGADQDALRLGRIMRERRYAETHPALDRRAGLCGFDV
jgi:hypothetical protein